MSVSATFKMELTCNRGRFFPICHVSDGERITAPGMNYILTYDASVGLTTVNKIRRGSSLARAPA